MASVCCVCQHTNPADAKYCNECGDLLRQKLCARCNAVSRIGARNCDHCGADLDEAEAAVLEVAPSASPLSGLRSAMPTGARFNFDKGKRADHSNPPVSAEDTLPSDVAAAANVDFLIFPAVQAGSSHTDSACDPAVLAPASESTDAANVDFLIFPASETGDAEIGGKQSDSSFPSAEPRDARWHERWGGAPLQQTSLSLFAGFPAHRDESKATEDEAPVEPARSSWLIRPRVVGLALVLVVCVAAFYAIQLDNPFKNSGDRQLQGSIIGTFPIRTPHEGDPRASEAGKMKSAAGEPAARANESSSTDAIDNEPAARGPSEAVQGAASTDERAQKRVTTKEKVSDGPTPARSRATTAGRARPVPAREPTPARLQQPSTTASCVDSIAALGLCGATTGR